MHQAQLLLLSCLVCKCLCLCARASVCVCCLIHAVRVWRPGDSPQELALSLYCGGSGKAAQFFRPVQRVFLLSGPSIPRPGFRRDWVSRHRPEQPGTFYSSTSESWVLDHRHVTHCRCVSVTRSHSLSYIRERNCWILWVHTLMSKMAAHFASRRDAEGSCFPTFLMTLVMACPFGCSHFSGCKQEFHCGFYFLVTNDIVFTQPARTKIPQIG